MSAVPDRGIGARLVQVLRDEGALVAAIAALLVAFGARLAVVINPRTAILDSDQAVTGISAQRIGAGEAFPVFFPGQAYMGSLEQYLQAPVLLALPDTTPTLQLVGVLLGTITTGVVLLLGRLVTGSLWGGVLAAGLFAIGPWYLLLKGVMSHGAYAAGTLAALTCLLLALRLDPASRRAPLVAAGIGLTAGLTVWELWLGFYLVIPAVVWALATMRREPALLLAGLAGGLVGASPFLAQRLSAGLDQRWSTESPAETTVADRARGLFDPVLGQFLGVGRLDGSGIVTGVGPRAVVLLAVAGLAAAVWYRRRGLLALVTLREGTRRPIDAILLAFLIAPPLYVATRATWFTAEPRYLFTLYPVLAVALAAAVAALSPRARAPVGLALLGVMAALTVTNAREATRQPPLTYTLVGNGSIDMKDLPGATDELERLGVRTAWADYWLAYPITYLSGGQVEVAPFSQSRFPHLDERVRASRSPALIAPEGPAAEQIRAELAASGTRYDEQRARQLVVFSGLDPLRTPRELGLRPCLDCALPG